MKVFYPGVFSSLLLFAVPAVATEVNVRIDLSGALATQSSTLPGYPASNAIDGNRGNFTHTDIPESNASWTLTLPSLVQFNSVQIWNRGDGCCGYRLSDLTFTAYSDASGTVPVYTSPTLNPGNSLGTPSRIDLSPGNLGARVIKISRAASDPNTHDGSVLSLGEVEFYNRSNVLLPSGTNLTQAGIVAMMVGQSSGYNGNAFPAFNATDGNNGNFTHTDSNDTNASWFVDFGENMSLESLNLHNRGDGCCQGRLRDLTVTVFNLTGSPIFTSPIQNGGNALNGPADIFLDLASLNGGAPLLGSKVMVSRASLPGGGDDNNVLSLGEVTVMGGSIPEPASSIFFVMGIAGLVARRKRPVTA